MTIPDSLRLSLDAIPTGRGDAAPPVNNACMPDQYNKLDADVIERTRVLNALLTMKLQVQERVLQKYRTAAERSYIREKDKVKSDLRNIGRRLPNYADIPNLETKIKRLRRRKNPNKNISRDCAYTTEPIGMKGISAEKDDKPYCDRYIHHHIPTKGKGYKKILPAVSEGMRMLDFRPRPRAAVPLIHHAQTPRDSRDPDVIRDQDINRDLTRDPEISRDTNRDPTMNRDPDMDRVLGREKVIPPIHALDDSFMLSKSRINDDDDDWRTV